MENNEWREQLRPKVTIFMHEHEDAKEIAMFILEEYWKHLEPAIEKLLLSERQKVIEMIREFQKENSRPDSAVWYRLQELLDKLTKN